MMEELYALYWKKQEDQPDKAEVFADNTVRVLIRVDPQTVCVDEEVGQVCHVRLSTEGKGVYRVNVFTTTFSR
jgi:hypothetical protein